MRLGALIFKFWTLNFLLLLSNKSLTQNIIAPISQNQEVSNNEYFKNLIGREFSNIVTGTTFSNLGNFASISTEANSMTVGTNFISENSIIGVEISGGTSDGLLSVFNNGNINSNLELDLKYHLGFKKRYASINIKQKDSIELLIKKETEKLSKETIQLINQKKLRELKIENLKKKHQISKLKKEITENIKLSQDIETDKNIEKLSIKESRDSLKIENKLKEVMILEIVNDSLINRAKIDEIEIDSEEYFALELEYKTQEFDFKIAKLEKSKKDLQLRTIDVSWFTFGWNAKKNEFNLFDISRIGNELSDTSFVSQNFTASYSRYKSSSLKLDDFYFSGGLAVNYTTNINTLTGIKIEEREAIREGSNTAIVKSIDAFTGEYKSKQFNLTIFVDYYKFFRYSESSFAFHFNPTISFDDELINNLTVGLVLPFRKKDSQSSILNIELFYTVNDIFNNVVNRDRIGISATFPITFLTN